MKKYLNKGLLYAWFNSAKAAILIGLFLWGVVAHGIIKQNIANVKNDLASEFSNYMYTTDLYEYLPLGVIFIAIYFIAKGINKRNTEMFLSSGPYTKMQIRYNEFICLLITLFLFIIVYIYISIMLYFSNREFVSIIEGYLAIISIEILKIILFGIIGIIFMLIIDSMFSNSVIGFISMISVIPISIMMIIRKSFMILEYFGIRDNYSLLDKIRGVTLNEEFERYNRNLFFERLTVKEIAIKELSIEIIVALIIIIIMIIIYSMIQRKYELEKANKIFSSKANGKILVTLISVAAGTFGTIFFTENFIHSMQRKNGEFITLTGMNLIKGLTSDIICIAVIGFISYKVIQKILKNII